MKNSNRNILIVCIAVLLTLSIAALSTHMVLSQRRATDNRLTEVLNGYVNVTRSTIQSHAKFLAQQTRVLVRDRQLVGMVKCWADVEMKKYGCAEKFIPESMSSRFEGEPITAIFEKNPGILEEFKTLLHLKIDENSRGPMQRLKSIYPDIDKLSFYFGGKEVYRFSAPGFGDRVDRPMIGFSEKEKRGVSGIELDKGEVGYFQTIPFFYPEQYIIAEIGIPISAILRDIQATTQAEHVAFVYLDGNIYALNSNVDVGELDPSSLDVNSMERDFEKKERTVFSVPVKDYSGKVVGKVIIVKNIDALLSKESDTILTTIFILVITALTLITALVTIFNSLKRADTLNEKLKEYSDTLEYKVEERTYELKEANKELHSFAHTASHDLQEPLRKISVYGDLLEKEYSDVVDEEGKKYIESMKSSATRMQSLISAILSYSQIMVKGEPFVPVDLNVAMQEAIDDLQIRIKETEGKVECKVLPTIDANPVQMRQLLFNLVGNSLKYRKNDVAPLVKVSAKIKTSGNNPTRRKECVITVEDNGIGFDQKYSEKIFTIFQRLHGKSEYEGTGIGLALCSKIVKLHGGTISANANPGLGATFTIKLPLKQIQEDKHE